MIEWTVEAAKLAIAEAEILKAVAEYRGAVDRALSAGNALAANWEGEAQVVFVEEQNKAYRWHISICDIVSAFAETLKATAAKYEQYEQQVKSLIQG